MALKLPDLQGRLPIVDEQRRPLASFLRFFNIEFKGAIERNAAQQEQTVADLQVIVDGLQATQIAAQAAQQAANNAQTAADGGTAVSGSSTNPAVDVVGSGWVTGPQVDLTGVVAGDLKITGSGPQQDSDVVLSGGKGQMNCNFRIVEVVGGVDDVVFLGDFTLYKSGSTETPIVTNLSSSSVESFVSARTSTGAVSYRIDVRGTGARVIDSLLLYVFARRSV